MKRGEGGASGGAGAGWAPCTAGGPQGRPIQHLAGPRHPLVSPQVDRHREMREEVFAKLEEEYQKEVLLAAGGAGVAP